MKQWFGKLINIGTDRPLPFEQMRSVKVLNLIALITVVSGGIFFVANLIYGRYILSALNSITLTAGILMLVCHYKGYYENGYTLLSAAASVVFFTSSILYHNNMEYYLLLITVLSVILMKNNRLRLIFGLINSAAFLFVYKYGHTFHYFPEVGEGRRFVNIFVWQVILLVIAWYFNIQGVNRQKLIEEKNDLLEENKLTLEDNNRQLQVLNSTKEKLFSIVAHDVRSPIAGVRGVLELFNNGDISDRELKTLSVQMASQLDQLRSNLDNLLQWSHSQLDGIEVHASSINLKKLVEETLKLAHHNLSVKHIEVELDIDNDCVVFVDGNQAQIIVRNLLSNAIKFSYPGGKIYLSTTTGPSMVSLKVKDEGTGIKPEVLDVLFTDNQLAITEYGTQQEKGHGIGLLLCKEFAVKNKGNIRVQSEYGKGSLFILDLPK